MPNANEPGAQPGQGGADGAQPEYVTADQIGNIVNAAVSSHLKRSLAKEIAGALEQQLAPIKQRLAEAPPPPADDAAAGKGGSKAPTPEMQAMQKQLADMQAAMKAAQDEAASEKKKAREEKAYSALKSELTGKVRPEALDAAADLIFHARKRIAVDDDGNVLFNVRSSLGKGLPEEDRQFPLADGVREFLKTQEAALFVPSPSGGNGAQKRPTQQQPRAPGAAPRYDTPAKSQDEMARRALEALAAKGLDLP